MLFLVQVCEAPSSFSSSWRAEVQKAARGRRASPPSRGRLEFPLLRLSSRVLSSLAVNVNRCSREWNLTGPAGQPDWAVRDRERRSLTELRNMAARCFTVKTFWPSRQDIWKYSSIHIYENFMIAVACSYWMLQINLKMVSFKHGISNIH